MAKILNDSHLRFVARYYEEGKLNTKRALHAVKNRAGISTTTARTIALRRWMAAASLLVLIVGAAYLYVGSIDERILLSSADRTELFILPDSTHITLSPHSTIAYTRKHPRSIRLKGDAYLEVKRDEQHPFTISNDISTVRVLGTKFQVISGNGAADAATTVYVTEGKVLFSALNEQQGLTLTRGMKARLMRGSRMPVAVEAGTDNQTAWATGRLHYDNTPLDVVLRELSELYRLPLHAAPTTKCLSADFTVTPELDNIGEIIALIEQTLEVEIKNGE